MKKNFKRNLMNQPFVYILTNKSSQKIGVSNYYSLNYYTQRFPPG